MLIFTLAGTKVLLTVFMFTSSESSLTAQVEAIPIFRNNTRILFQGDSITDGKRDRGSDPNHMLGHGGISGNRIIDLAGRWKQDTIDVKPDILSILIGINDNMHWKYKNNTFENWIPFEEFENTYDNLLKEFRVHYPKSYLVLCLPFTLRVNGKYWSVDGFEEFEKNLKKRMRVITMLAEKYQAALVNFQPVLTAACERAPPSYWVWDGVHPTYSGHQLFADEWIRAVRDHWVIALES